MGSVGEMLTPGMQERGMVVTLRNCLFDTWLYLYLRGLQVVHESAADVLQCCIACLEYSRSSLISFIST